MASERRMKPRRAGQQRKFPQYSPPAYLPVSNPQARRIDQVLAKEERRAAEQARAGTHQHKWKRVRVTEKNYVEWCTGTRCTTYRVVPRPVRLMPLHPVRCPHCRSRLTSRLSRHGSHVKWCRQCRCIVRYELTDEQRAAFYEAHPEYTGF